MTFNRRNVSRRVASNVSAFSLTKSWRRSQSRRSTPRINLNLAAGPCGIFCHGRAHACARSASSNLRGLIFVIEPDGQCGSRTIHSLSLNGTWVRRRVKRSPDPTDPPLCVVVTDDNSSIRRSGIVDGHNPAPTQAASSDSRLGAVIGGRVLLTTTGTTVTFTLRCWRTWSLWWSFNYLVDQRGPD